MIQAADLREWRTCDVIDSSGHKIGSLEAVYVDTSTDEPAMATVRVGLPARHRLVFVPLDVATAPAVKACFEVFDVRHTRGSSSMWPGCPSVIARA